MKRPQTNRVQLRITARPAISILALVGSSLLACGDVTTFGGDGAGGGAGGSTETVEGLPCEVVDLLESHCVSCHSDPPRNAAPMAMVTYEQLAAPSPSDPSRTVAEMSIERMASTDAPMPPGSQLPAEVVAAFEAWVGDGMPRGDCQSSGETVVCTSGQTWTWGYDPPNESRRSEMNPGMACNGCHTDPTQEEDGPTFQIAGTVYPTLHEPDLCFGEQGVMVEVTDAAGHTITMTTNATGNFSYEEGVALVMPITARVTRGDTTVAMTDPVDTGDCNSCHTQDGAEGAPGRIRVP
jgi:hypothetical protein